MLRIIPSAALVAALALAAPSALAQPAGPVAEAAQASAPLSIARQGFFYVGGKRHETEAGPVIADRMYVEFQIPAQQTQPYPLVFFHGGGPSGVVWTMTPDGRPGWRDYFLRRGFAVYIVDAPMIGRSGYNSLVDGAQTIVPNIPQPPPAPGAAPRWPQEVKHTQSPATGGADDPVRDAMAAYILPGVEAVRGGTIPPPLPIVQRTDEIVQAAASALLDRIGPAIIVTHSRSGTYSWLIPDARPNLVKGVVAVEPNGPPYYNNLPGAPPQTETARPWGLTYARLNFDPAPASAADIAPTRQQRSEGPGLVGCWDMGGRRRTLPNLRNIPILIVSGEASYHAQYDQCTSRFLTRAGVPNEYVRLESVGIHGNGHSMMGEKNSDEVAAFIADWLVEKVR
ncbi:MAG: hypothetical protein JNJ73_10775 [Hyphomonadaceae bacterium]|nr:hypothetical protein [Hyphomonadaceae bacterium]